MLPGSEAADEAGGGGGGGGDKGEGSRAQQASALHRCRSAIILAKMDSNGPEMRFQLICIKNGEGVGIKGS
ncbi:hypothetical protein NL676_010837 [Syzygium grande]|nr:hypothetical protein NL676_010837 [Syzygium grande]